MKIGILQCDSVLPELQPEFGDYPDMFRHLMREADATLELVFFDAVAGDLPASPDQCDAYMTTGSRHGVNDDLPWIRPLEQFVRSLYWSEKKFVGICFGHQLLARALGGRVERTPRGWGIGVSVNRIVTRKPWMEPFKPTLNLIVSHQDQVTVLPPGTTVLAGSEFCPNYMVACGDHFIGIQGHPEFSKGYSRALCERRRDRIPGQRINEAYESLALNVDDVLVAKWIVRFFHD